MIRMTNVPEEWWTEDWAAGRYDSRCARLVLLHFALCFVGVPLTVVLTDSIPAGAFVLGCSTGLAFFRWWLAWHDYKAELHTTARVVNRRGR